MNSNHQGSSKAHQSVDIEDAIAKTLQICTPIYYKLEDCLADNDRDWRKCQEVVKELKICNDKNLDAKKNVERNESN